MTIPIYDTCIRYAKGNTAHAFRGVVGAPLYRPSPMPPPPVLYCVFLTADAFPTGWENIHRAQNASHPVMVTPMPAIQGHAPEMTNERGHSSCAMWRTETVLFSSRLDRNGRL